MSAQIYPFLAGLSGPIPTPTKQVNNTAEPYCMTLERLITLFCFFFCNIYSCREERRVQRAIMSPSIPENRKRLVVSNFNNILICYRVRIYNFSG